MDLYFSPLAGSLAARIALYEAGADARFIEVDTETKRTSDGSDFAEIYPLGLVPRLAAERERRDPPIHCQSISLIEPRPHR